MTQLEMFKNNWKPNYSDSSYECFCFRTDLNKLVEEIRAEERAKTLKEVMPILLSIVDEEGCCYGFENEINRLEEEYLNLN